MKDFIFIAFIICGLTALSFLGIAACVKIICWAFGLVFTWKVALGVWAVLILLRSIFKQTARSEERR